MAKNRAAGKRGRSSDESKRRRAAVADSARVHEDDSPARVPAVPAGFILAVILLGGLFMRAMYLREIVNNPDFSAPTIDAGFHDYWARAMVTGDWAPPPGRGDPQVRTTPFLRPPGYPYFLAIVYRVAGLSYITPRVVQMFLGLLNAGLAYLIGRRWFGRNVGLVWAGLMSLYWVFIFFEGEFHAPTLLIFLLLCAVALLGRWADKRGPGALIAAGAVLGLAALVRPNVLLFLPTVVVWACWLAKKRQNWRPLKWALPGFILAALVVIAPATIRNYRVAGDFVLISSNAGINLFIGNNENATGNVADELPGLGEFSTCYDYPAIVANLERQEGRPLKPSEVSSVFTQRALAFIRQDPGQFVRLTFRKLRMFWASNEIAHNKDLTEERRQSSVLGLLPGNFAAIASLAVVGLVSLVSRFRQSPRTRKGNDEDDPPDGCREVTLLIVLFVAVYCLSVIPFFVSARYRVPVIPLLMLLSAVGIWRFVFWFRSGRSQRGVFAAAAALAVYAVSFTPLLRFPGNPAKWYCDRGLAYSTQGRPDLAVEAYREALRLNPDSRIAQINLATVLSEQGLVAEAIEHCTAALQTSPNSAALHNTLGLTLARTGQSDQAIQHLQTALQLQPDVIEVRYNLADLLTRQGKAQEAIDLLNETIALRPDAAPAYLHLGNALATLDRFDDALEKYGRALELKPDYAEAHFQIGRVLRRRGDLGGAEDRFTKAIAADANHGQAHLALATLMTRMGNLDRAIAEYQQVIRIQPQFALAHNDIGSLKSRQGKWAEAEEYFRAATKLDPAFAMARNNLGLALVNMGRTIEAVEEYKAAVAIDTKHVGAWINLGKALESLQSDAEAFEAYRQAVQSAPDNADAHYYFGRMLHKQGKMPEATIEYRAALRCDPNHANARKALDLATSGGAPQ